MEKNILTENSILPLGEHITSAWPETNFLISLLQTKATGWDWIMNSHIQLRASSYVNYLEKIKDTRIMFYPYGMHDLTPSIYDMCPFLDKYVIPREWVKNKYDSFSSFIEEVISNGFYVSTYMNQFFRNDMQGKEYYHPSYIYGYNRDRQLIYIVDCFENGKYMNKVISYMELELAFAMYKEEHWNASVFMYQMKDYDYQFSPGFVVDQLNDYLNPGKGVCYLNRTLCPEPIYKSKIYDNIVYFGKECYILLHQYIAQIIAGEMVPDIRSFCLLEDHKHLMKLRYLYMLENAYIKKSESLQKELDQLWTDSRIMTNIFLKGQVKGDVKLFEKVNDILYAIAENEEKVFVDFCNNVIM